MNTFTYTENGATQLRSSGNACLDLFAEVGSARNMAIDKPNVLQGLFLEAYKANPATAFCIALWARSVRLGAGERAVSRVLLQAVHQLAPQALAKHLELLGELGSYKDYVWVANEFPELREAVVKLFADGVMSGNYFACKWLPRGTKLWAEVRACTGLSNGDFRRRVAAHSATVEQMLCAGKLTEVEYDKLPSQAFNRYKRYFARMDGERLRECIMMKRLNTGALYPHEVFREFFNGSNSKVSPELMSEIIAAQWNSLPNYMPEGVSFLPVLDTSGSMTWGHSVIPREVAYPLALYCAERLSGPYRNRVVTFSSNARFIDLPGGKASPVERMEHLMRYEIVEDTNIASVFSLLLETAIKNGVTADAMPSCLLILSDMQFNQGAHYDIALMDILRLKFKYAGYKFPSIVYWNLDATNTGVAASAYDDCALVSGYSPRLLQAIFNGSMEAGNDTVQNIDPTEVMERALAPIRELVDSSVLPAIPDILGMADFNPTRGKSVRLSDD